MENSTLNRVLIGAGVVLVLAAGATWWWRQRAPEPVPEPPPVAATVPGPDGEDTLVEHPVPTSTEEVAPLPAAPEADGPLALELGQIFGTETIATWLEPRNVLRRLVATVDGLPRANGANRLRPVKPVTPTFMVDRVPPSSITADEHIYISPQNAARYRPLVMLLEATDMQDVARLYQRWYPLLQQTYEELGYPGRYFNDRLVSVIDHLLETPQVKGPIELVQPNVMYEYADPQLEALSSGQKLLLRMGPENAARVQAKLRELRAIVTQQFTQQGAQPATSPANSPPA